MSAVNRFCLVNDGDGHWYAIPVSVRDEFDRWMQSFEDEEGADWVGTDFTVMSIGCDPSSVTFSDYEIG